MKTFPWFPSFLAGMCLLFASGCTVHDHAYATGPAVETYYDYEYYPAYDVYYYPRTRVYYWNDRGRWSAGHRPPPHYELRAAQREPFRSHSRQPWAEQPPGHH